MGTSGAFSRFLQSYNDQIAADSVDAARELVSEDVAAALQAVAEAVKGGRDVKITSVLGSAPGRGKKSVRIKVNGEILEITPDTSGGRGETFQVERTGAESKGARKSAGRKKSATPTRVVGKSASSRRPGHK